MAKVEDFVQAIVAEPDDDTHRLVFADWLEDSNLRFYANAMRFEMQLRVAARDVKLGEPRRWGDVEHLIQNRLLDKWRRVYNQLIWMPTNDGGRVWDRMSPAQKQSFTLIELDLALSLLNRSVPMPPRDDSPAGRLCSAVHRCRFSCWYGESFYATLLLAGAEPRWRAGYDTILDPELCGRQIGWLDDLSGALARM